MTNDQPGFLLDLVLKIPARLFGAVAKMRGHLYDSKRLPVVDSGAPVISIGNLTAGGTGKTPITSYLATDLRLRGIACAIVSRGYGAAISGPALVPPKGEAKQFGDEPSWLATRHPDIPVVIGPRRPEAIQFLKASRTEKFVILADDAFQHRRLKRDLDIVILDPTEPRWHYRPLPLGRMREDFAALMRAHFIFVSKTNLAETRQLSWLRDRIREAGKPSVEFKVALNGFVPLDQDSPGALPQMLKARRAILMTGIARPQTFEQLVIESVPGLKILKHFIFQDHHAFTMQDLEGVEKRAMELQADAILVTEKDATKLREWHPQFPCYVSRLVAEPLTSLGEFHEALDRLL